MNRKHMHLQKHADGAYTMIDDTKWCIRWLQTPWSKHDGTNSTRMLYYICLEVCSTLIQTLRLNVLGALFCCDSKMNQNSIAHMPWLAQMQWGRSTKLREGSNTDRKSCLPPLITPQHAKISYLPVTYLWIDYWLPTLCKLEHRWFLHSQTLSA